MDGMILAAGLGTRLGALARTRPKALVEVGGVTLLERVARRLVGAGVDRLIVNLHAFAAEVERFLRERAGFGADLRLSHERDGPLETGGGIAAAREHFRKGIPCLVHNVDVLTDLPLVDLVALLGREGPMAVLAVMERETPRRLLFDDAGLLGRVDRGRGLELRAREARGPVRDLAFAGVHALAPGLARRLPGEGAFSVWDAYLRLVGEGGRILPLAVQPSLWIDVGTPARVAEAERTLAALS